MAKAKHTAAPEVLGKAIEPLINALTKNPDDREAITRLITQEGPPHKQWQHSLVLSRLQVALAKLGKLKGKKFKAAKGEPIIVFDPKHETEEALPIGYPAQSSAALDEDEEGMVHLSKGPLHEVAYTAILLQAIEWIISVAEPVE